MAIRHVIHFLSFHYWQPHPLKLLVYSVWFSFWSHPQVLKIITMFSLFFIYLHVSEFSRPNLLNKFAVVVTISGLYNGWHCTFLVSFLPFWKNLLCHSIVTHSMHIFQSQVQKSKLGPLSTYTITTDLHNHHSLTFIRPHAVAMSLPPPTELQEVMVLVVFFCLFVCLLAGLHKNYLTDVDEIFIKSLSGFGVQQSNVKIAKR